MEQQTTLLTADDLIRMPDDGFHRYELVAGRLVTMTPAGFVHGHLGVRVLAAVLEFVEARGLGVVAGADTGFVLEHDPDTVRAPDVSFVSQSRIPESGLPEGFWRGAPDLAVEVKSPSDRRRALMDKMQEYLRSGAVEGWLVDPERKQLLVFGRGPEPVVLG